MYSPSVKKRRNKYSSVDIEKSITKIQKWEISQAKLVCEFGITRQTLARKCNNKIENAVEKRPDYFTFMLEATEKDLVQWTLAIQKKGLPVV